jgi:pyruvate dehydrogenase kinase 2/3/4
MLKQNKPPTAHEEGEINQFLNEFNWRRIDTRMIMGQHIAMHTERPGYIGMIALDCNLEEIVQLAIDDADLLCDRHMGVSPPVDVQIFKQGPFAYVPAFLHHMMFEIVKNAMKATVQKHESREGDLPHVKIVLSIPEDGEDLVIKVHDKGGGMDSHTLSKIWDYFFTTADKHIDLSDTSLQSGAHGYTVPLCGYGHGLPLSRLYAQYFGGDIEVVSMINYGTDVYFNLKRLDPELHLSGPAR